MTDFPYWRLTRTIGPLLVLAVLGCSKHSASTNRDSTAKEPLDTTVLVGKTRLQSFQAKTGSVVIFGFTPIAVIPDMYGGTTSIEARELTDATSGARATGVGVEVKETGALDRKETSYVDYDELESLLRGIDYIAKIDKNPTKLHDFQAEYRTRGDLTVSTFSSNSGQILVALKSGTIGGAEVFYALPKLLDFRAAILRAKTLLDSISRTTAKDSAVSGH